MERKVSVKTGRPAPHVREEIRRKNAETVRRRRRLTMYVSVTILVILVVALVVIMRQPRLQISKIVISGNQLVSSDLLQRTIERELAGSYFFLIPKSNALVYPKENIRRSVLSSAGYIESIELDVRTFSTLAVKVVEREPAYIWCDVSASDTCYLTDDTGLIFADSSSISRNLMMTIESKLAETAIGTRPLGQHFAELHEVVGALPQILSYAGIPRAKARSVRVSEGGDFFFTIEERRDGSPATWELRLSRRIGFDASATHLKAVWASEDFARDRQGGELQYVDLRFGKKVFYRFGWSSPEQTESDIL